MSAATCPDCGGPDRYCFCMLRADADIARRNAREQAERATLYLTLWQAAASCLRHNRARLAKPRGADERRMLEWADTDMLGVLWSGRTDGWIPDPPERPADDAQGALDLGGVP